VTKIAVCICTFRNPSGLRLLLEVIDKQEFDTLLDEYVTIVVVDNDADASAAIVLKWYQRAGRFKLCAQNQPKRGLSSARNSALNAPCVGTSEFIAFLDDDEIPSTRWLQTLINSFLDPACSIVIGPVDPIFEAQPPSWIVSGEFFHKRCKGSKELNEGYSSNVMIRRSIVEQSGVRFDESLNLVGGEDALFFRELRVRGFFVYCAPQAVVSETISKTRATLPWLLRRWFRAGATSARLRNVSNNALRGILANATGGILRIAVGSLSVVVVTLTRGRKDFAAVARSMSTVCRGAGMLMAAFGQRYEEYGSSYRRKTMDGSGVD
jgi:succinoglycan biosynthesis protein ExoM